MLIRLLKVLAVEACPGRRTALLHHADLALAAGRAGIEDAAGLADLERRRAEAG